MVTRYYPLARGFAIYSTYGPRWGTIHRGLDFGWPGGSAGKPVYAVQSGTVTQIGWDPGGFGWFIDIDSDDAQGSNLWVYGHVKPEVTRGDAVVAGQRIAHINGDRATNGNVDPHCHLEVHKWTRQPAGPGRMDPAPFLEGALYPGEGVSSDPVEPSDSVGTVFGIDVSNNQGAFDFDRAKAEKFEFATHKILEIDGDEYPDRYWLRARAAMARLWPGRWGGYVFCRRITDPRREADRLAHFAGTLDFPLQIDYEDNKYGGNLDDLWARYNAYREVGFTRFLPVYIPRWYWSGHMGSPDLTDFPLPIWNSHYVTGSDFASNLYPGDGFQGWAPVGGKEVAILQFTEQAQVAGQRIDANAIRGGLAKVDAIFGGAGASNPDDDPAWDAVRKAVGLG